MTTQTQRSEKDKLKDKRFKQNVAELLKRYEREVQEARNRGLTTPPVKETPPQPPAAATSNETSTAPAGA